MPNIFISFLKFLPNSMYFRIFDDLLKYSLAGVLFVFLSACSNQKSADSSHIAQNNSPLVASIFSTNALVKQLIKQKKPLSDILKYRSNTMVVYTSIQGVTLSNTLTEYTTNSNVDITLVTYGKSDDELIEFLKQKPKSYQADIVLLSSAVAYERANDAQVLQPVLFESGHSKRFSKFKKTWNNWLPLAFTSNVVVYNPSMVSEKPSASSLSQLLLSPNYKKICFPSLNTTAAHQLFTNAYKQTSADHVLSLLDRTQNKFVALNNDHEILEHVQQKKCQVGVVSLVNYEQFIANKPTNQLAVVYPKNNATLIGAGITNQSFIPLKSLRFLQWLSSVDGQLLFNGDYKTLPTHTHLNTYQVKQPIQNTIPTTGLAQNKPVNQHKDDAMSTDSKTSFQKLQALYLQELNRLTNPQDNMMVTEQKPVQFDKDKKQQINLLQLKINATKQLNDRSRDFPINSYALVTSEEIKQVKTLIENRSLNKTN